LTKPVDDAYVVSVFYLHRFNPKISVTLFGGSSPVNAYGGAAGSYYVRDLVGKFGSQRRMTFDARDPHDPIKDTAPSFINVTDNGVCRLDQLTVLGTNDTDQLV